MLGDVNYRGNVTQCKGINPVCESGFTVSCSGNLSQPSSATPNYIDSYSSSNSTCSGSMTARILFGPTCFAGKNGPTQVLCGSWGAAIFSYHEVGCQGGASSRGYPLALKEGCKFMGGFLAPGSDEYLTCPLPSNIPNITHSHRSAAFL